jgi:TonB family protein
VQLLLFVVAVLAPALSLTGTSGRPNKQASLQPFALRMDLLKPASAGGLESFMNDAYRSIWLKSLKTFPQDASLGQKGVVAVHFAVRKDGTLAESYPTLESSSRKSLLDEHAMKAVRDSAPFDPLPDSLSSPQIELRANFYYNVIPPPQCSKFEVNCPLGPIAKMYWGPKPARIEPPLN